MVMDIISGIVLTTSALIFAVALTGIIAINSASRNQSERGQQEVLAGARGIQGTLLVVYFVATTHLLLIAQQVNLALANFVIGLVLIVVQFIEPSLRGGHRPSGEQENWRR